MHILPKLSAQPTAEQKLQAEANNSVIRYSAKIGGQLFGPIPKGRRREFFCLDRHTWVWLEEWTDAGGVRRSVMTQYHIRQGGVLKSQGDQAYSRISASELSNFYQAVALYDEVVPSALQRLVHQAK